MVAYRSNLGLTRESDARVGNVFSRNCPSLNRRRSQKSHSTATIAMKDCTAVAVHFENLAQEGALLDTAVSSATDELRVLLLGNFVPVIFVGCLICPAYRQNSQCDYCIAGDAAKKPPSLQTLDLLALCFASSARLRPVLDIVPIFPFLQSVHGKYSVLCSPADARFLFWFHHIDKYCSYRCCSSMSFSYCCTTR